MYGILSSDKIIAKFVAPLTLRSESNEFGGDALSLVRSFQRTTAQRWRLNAGVEPLTYNANELYIHLVTKGSSVPFEITVPQNFGVISSRVSTNTVLATGALHNDTITISGANGLIPAGTMVKFNNHSKVYMITENTSGGTAKVYPPLRKDISLTKMYYRDDVRMSVYYDTSVVKGMVYTDGIMMNIGSIDFIEALEKTP